MKKVLIAFSMPITFFAQNNDVQPTVQDDKCVSSGTYIIDAFYGGPFIVGDLSGIGTSTSTNSKSINTNHIGGKVEYMVSKVVGIGLEYTYAKASSEYTDTYSSGSSTTTSTFYTSLTKHRALAKVNFHFSTTKHFDWYSNIGIGLKIIDFSTNNPNILQEQIGSESYSFLIYNLIPIAVRSGLGVRYYFSSNFGISAEIGLGGPLGQIGITAKF